MSRILLVDDDDDLRETLQECLQMQGFVVETAAKGAMALELLDNSRFDLVVMDWDLPDINGVEVCQRYRSSGGTDRILMLTGKRTAADRAAGIDSGANELLTKPFTLDQLMKQLRSMLNPEGTC